MPRSAGHSSSGLGRRPLTAVARVQIPYALLLGEPSPRRGLFTLEPGSNLVGTWLGPGSNLVGTWLGPGSDLGKTWARPGLGVGETWAGPGRDEVATRS